MKWNIFIDVGFSINIYKCNLYQKSSTYSLKHYDPRYNEKYAQFLQTIPEPLYVAG